MSTILSVPHHRQSADGYCLPACVQMLLAYWGIERPQADLAKQLGLIEGAGTPGNRLRRLASKELNVFYSEGTLSDLTVALDEEIPLIVLVNTRELPYWEIETAHAVVLRGLENSRATINDPAFEIHPFQISLGDFLLAWDEMANLYAKISLP